MRAGRAAALALDERGVAEMYRLHAPSIFRRCLALSGGNAHWAEDATHDVFVRLLERRDEVDPSRNVEGWLRAVTFRLCIDRLRRERNLWSRIKDKLLATDRDARRIDAETALQIKTKLQRAQALLEGLTVKERAVVVLKHFEGLRQNEVAEALGWSEGYVSKVLKRATERMRLGGAGGLE